MSWYQKIAKAASDYTGVGADEDKAGKKDPPLQVSSVLDYGSNLARQSDLAARGEEADVDNGRVVDSESGSFADAYTELRYRCEMHERPPDLFALLSELAPQHLLDIDKRYHGHIADWIANADEWELYDGIVAQARRIGRKGKMDEERLEYDTLLTKDAGVEWARDKAKEMVEPGILDAIEQELGLLDGAEQDEDFERSAYVDFYQQQDIALGGSLPDKAGVANGAVLSTLAWLDDADLKLEANGDGTWKLEGFADMTFQVVLPDGRVLDLATKWWGEGAASTSWWSGTSFEMTETRWNR